MCVGASAWLPWRPDLPGGVGLAPDGGHGVDVADSGGDFFGLIQRSLAEGHAFLIRFCPNRRIAIDEGTEERTASHRRDAVRSWLASNSGSRGSPLGGAGRPVRVAWRLIAWHRVRIVPPWGVSRFRTATPIEVTVLRIGEADPLAGETGRDGSRCGEASNDSSTSFWESNSSASGRNPGKRCW